MSSTPLIPRAASTIAQLAKNRLRRVPGKVAIELLAHDVWKQFHEVITNLLTDVEYEIVCEPNGKFSGLEVSTVNQSGMCMIQARIGGVVDVRDSGTISFLIKASTFHNALEFAGPNDTVALGIEDDKVCVFVVGSPGTPTAGGFEIPRMVLPVEDRNDKLVLPDILFKYTVQFRQSVFRKYIKLMAALKMEVVRLCLYEPKDANHGKKSGSPKDLVFAFLGSSDQATVEYTFRAVVGPAPPRTPGSEMADNHFAVNDHMPVPANTDDMLSDSVVPHSSEPLSVMHLSEMREIYNAPYNLRFLMHFTKNIDRHDLTLYLSPEYSLMLIHFPVGDDDYVRFVLMQCANDSSGGGDNMEVA